MILNALIHTQTRKRFLLWAILRGKNLKLSGGFCFVKQIPNKIIVASFASFAHERLKFDVHHSKTNGDMQ